MESIARLPSDTKQAMVLISEFKAPYFERMVNNAGFENVKVLVHDESLELTDSLVLDMLVNDRGEHDSSVVLQGDGSTVFLQTDNLMTIEEAKRLGAKYDIDLLFAVTMLTGIFPGFYDFPPDEMVALAEKKRSASWDYSLSMVEALGARHVVPYASDLCYLGDLFFANALHRHEKDTYLGLLKERLPGVEGIRMWPDDEIELHDGKVTSRSTPQSDGLPEIAAYSVAMRKEVAAAALEEHSRIDPPMEEAIRIFRDSLDSYAKSAWKEEAFRVLWKVIDEDETTSCFGHTMIAPTQDCDEDWPYDLSIEMPLYRLRRLVHGDFLMGFMALWNGSLRCHRHSKDYFPPEQKFWRWANLFRM
jgi:hypothetical protein